MSLNPARTYFWKTTWSNAVRVVVQDGRGGPTLYNLVSARGHLCAEPHYAYLGADRLPARSRDLAGRNLRYGLAAARGLRRSEMR